MNLTSVVGRINDFLGALLPLLIALGVVYFVWGVVQYFINDNEEAKTKGRDRIIYGIIGLTVIISLWGIVYLLADTLGVRGQSALNVTGLVSTTSASTSGTCVLGPKIQGLLDYVTCIIGKSVVPLMFAIAVVMFIWGAIKFFIIEVDEEAKRTQGKQFMIWGIIALAVMISIWGLVNILGQTFSLQNTLPQVSPP